MVKFYLLLLTFLGWTGLMRNNIRIIDPRFGHLSGPPGFALLPLDLSRENSWRGTQPASRPPTWPAHNLPVCS